MIIYCSAFRNSPCRVAPPPRNSRHAVSPPSPRNSRSPMPLPCATSPIPLPQNQTKSVQICPKMRTYNSRPQPRLPPPFPFPSSKSDRNGAKMSENGDGTATGSRLPHPYPQNRTESARFRPETRQSYHAIRKTKYHSFALFLLSSHPGFTRPYYLAYVWQIRTVAKCQVAYIWHPNRDIASTGRGTATLVLVIFGFRCHI